MTKTTFSVTHKDPTLVELMSDTDHRTLAVWAIACAERVMPYFEKMLSGKGQRAETRPGSQNGVEGEGQSGSSWLRHHL